MAITWVQGTTYQASEGGPGTPITVTISGVGAGNCLIVSVGKRANLDTAHGLMYLTDNHSNKWLPPITSPSQVLSPDGGADFQLFTFVATNCAGGNTAITISESEHFGAYAIAIDEYSGVVALWPQDQVSFASTVYGSGLTSIASGAITAASGELVYSASFGMAASLTLTPTAGFTQRETVTGSAAYGITLTTWDKQSSGGSYSNTVSVGSDPNTIHVVIVGLSATTVAGPFVQAGAQCISAVSIATITAPFPYPNTAGNMLVAMGLSIERTDAVITDTKGNVWTTVYNDPGGTNNTVVAAYALGCKAGVNAVTMSVPSGGDDVHLMLIVEEFTPRDAFTASNINALVSSVSSIATGNVTVVVTPALLVSQYSNGAINGGGLSASGPAVQLGVMRYQFSDSGFFRDGVHVLGVADQIENSGGSYENTFNISPATSLMSAAILGFIGQVTLACPMANTGMIGTEYSSSLIASGGVLPYTFAIISGILPPGLMLASDTGLISGFPSTAGIYPYEAMVMDSTGLQATANCVIVIGVVATRCPKSVCGQMPTLELTRDLDADWDDSSTFYITQDVPLPFTLRGLVMRMSYNQD